ncbi:MAG TPA: hypothetical protein VKE71_13230 [Candidatus Angelobacter sp.]|nr:hypothetical protein [Candidatus Angelobacter sp.]
MKWLTKLLGLRSRPTGSSYVNHPLVIESPRIGFFNLLDPCAEGIVKEDVAALAPMFASAEERTDQPPNCSVLLLYAHIHRDGSIAGYHAGLRDIIRDAGAAIAIVAFENLAESYRAASKRTSYGQANLVLTLSRNGDAFARFYKELFSQMYAGATMPRAWFNLAPQIPGLKHEGLPGSYCLLEVGHIVFKW